MSFYDQLAPVFNLDDGLDPSRYQPAPDDWYLATTDIEGSTRAIERGQQKTVNMIAASCIAAARNASAGMDLPSLFGGDGATILIPPEHAESAFAALSGMRAFVRANTNLTLRAGAMRVGTLRSHGHDVLVARYEASPGNSFAMFRGGGVGFLDQVIKGREPGISAEVAILPQISSDPDLTGLSCLWQPIASRGGHIVSLVVTMADRTADYRPVLHRLLQIAGDGTRPATPASLEATMRRHWFPTDEAIGMTIAASGNRSWVGRLSRRLAILYRSFLLRLSLKLGVRFGRVDAKRYIAETARNSDFFKIGDTLQMVLDCTPEVLVRIESYLAQLETDGIIGFGLHVADSAVMTCLVESVAESRHVHFIDGAGGGYTQAAKALRQKLAAHVASAPP